MHMMKGFLLFLLAIVAAAVADPATLSVDLTLPGRPVPEHLFGVSFEEVNHAGSGGLWAELVSNRGFEAHNGTEAKPDIAPWAVIGNESNVLISTDFSSPIKHNPTALRVQILRDTHEDVGIYNPGFWGMNIEKGQKYRVTWYQRSSAIFNISTSFTGFNGSQVLASTILSSPSRFLNWTRMEIVLTAGQSNPDSRLQFTANRKGSMWFDQVSAMPLDTYKGHGFRKDVFEMIAELRPGFLRFPGGSSVEGRTLRNAFKWKKTVGPWEERPGHFEDVWNYWTDDGLGFYELLLLAEDLNAEPVLIVNCGMSIEEHVNTTSDIHPYVQDMLDGIEFARGEAKSVWGSVRAGMGHAQPFQMKYVTVGSENCVTPFYRGNYLVFYKALKEAYPDIQVISNCEEMTRTPNFPTDLMQYNRVMPPNLMFSLKDAFDTTPRDGPKVFVAEFAGTGDGYGNLLTTLAEAAFLMGVEKNCDIVALVCSPPLLVNANDGTWNPHTIVLDSSKVYGTSRYWLHQAYFSQSNGASFTSSTLETSEQVFASAISWLGVDQKKHTTIKVVNFGETTVDLIISFKIQQKARHMVGLSRTILESSDTDDENSFENPKMVYPITSALKGRGKTFNVTLSPYSLHSFDFSDVTRGEFRYLLEQLQHLTYILVTFGLVAVGVYYLYRMCVSVVDSLSNVHHLIH